MVAYRGMARHLSPVIPQHSILADEYDDAQDRGEIGKAGNSSNREELVSAADIGLSHKDIHEVRLIRDAEEADPA